MWLANNGLTFSQELLLVYLGKNVERGTTMRHFIGLMSVDLMDYAGINSCTIVAFIDFGCIKEIA